MLDLVAGRAGLKKFMGRFSKAVSSRCRCCLLNVIIGIVGKSAWRFLSIYCFGLLLWFVAWLDELPTATSKIAARCLINSQGGYSSLHKHWDIWLKIWLKPCLFMLKLGVLISLTLLPLSFSGTRWLVQSIRVPMGWAESVLDTIAISIG